MPRNKSNAIASVGNVSSNEEKSNMENISIGQHLFANRTTWTKTTFVPRLVLTEDQINQMSIEPILRKLIFENRIGLTSSARVSRQQGKRVLDPNRVQMDQLGRAICMVEHSIHAFGFEPEYGPNTFGIGLLDTAGTYFDRYLTAERVASGQLRYSAWYGDRVYDDNGYFANFVPGAKHKIDENNWEQVEGYNAWVNQHNEAVVIKAHNMAQPDALKHVKLTPEQEEMLLNAKVGKTPENYVQINNIKHINWDTVANKYVIEAWLLEDSSRPAFEIFSWAKDGNGVDTMLKEKLDVLNHAYRGQLKALAGLYVANAPATDTE